ncbi:serine/threonine-protein kinase [Acrocarpospora catenulata]|uniref:serine/threonine-protein kinase n=1 Tax=Acrocarpospora catenulata TaxID=2836182 RepID=UPI001BDA4014|nr:serine/threonine-protein kinase [Acrocarpospora catenulata]
MDPILDRYVLDATPLGGGGMGEVWRASDLKLARHVAIKFIRFPDGKPDEQLEARFHREAQIMARLRHPGAPVIHDIGAYEDPVRGRRLFLVMEFVDGVGLDDVVAEQGPLPVGWVASVGAQVAAVLEAAHEQGILHRDLKPANLMLRSDGSIQVVDFGLAVLRDPKLTKLTGAGQILGTASYMSPEQVEAKEPTPGSDIYSLGCVLYELLVGRGPFTGSTEFDVMAKQVSTLPDAIGKIRPDVPRELDELVLSMLAKRPEDRPATAAEVHDRLMPYLSGTGLLPGVTSPEPSPIRRYAHAVSRTLTARGPHLVAINSVQATAAFSRGDLGRARRRAASLVREDRYGEAAEVLAAMVEPAGRVLGLDDHEVLDLRGHLADVLFEGGDYQAAAQAFQQLAARLDAGDENGFQLRTQEALCRVHLGDAGSALRIMGELLADELRVYPEDDPRPLELRRQIGELEQSSGDVEQARRTLTALLDDLTRLYGPDHPATVRVAGMLTS